MNRHLKSPILALTFAVFGVVSNLHADPTLNPPLVCAAKASCSSCPKPDGPGLGCILVTLDLGSTTVWTGQTPVYLRIHSSDETASLSTPAQLKVVMGWSFKAVDGGTTAGGAPQIVRFVQPEGAELVVHFQDGDSVGVPEPNNLGKSLARVRMVDDEGWATTSAPAFYDLYPGDGSVWRFLAAGATNERGALVSYTDPRGRVLTLDDFGMDIVRDALGNIRQVKTLTRLADVRTLSPTHYAVTVYPLTEEPEQVADTGLYALPEHAPTRVLDVAQGESVKELLVGFQKGTGDMRQYRYVAVNGDWTLYQPSGLVEAQELYFTEDESGAQRLHTIRDETGKLWSRDEYNYVSAYWGYLITNRIEGIPGDATRTTSWSYYTDGPHKDLLCETVEPTGNRILYEYDDKNRVVRESMPLIEEETLYSYEPVDSSDPLLLCDTRPRCVVRKMQGVEIQRTYYVYGTNGVDVVERVGEQGAAYGGTNVLRTVLTYYPVTGAMIDGLVQSIRHENGMIDNYAYDLTNGVWTEFVTHVHEQAPDIVPMRTTRSVRVYNALGQLIDSRTDLCTIGVEDLVPQADWTPIARLQYAYDIDGNEIRREDLAGRLWISDWAGSCCGKLSETQWDGIQTLFTYGENDQLVVKTGIGLSTVETHYQYDRLGRLTGQFSTNTLEKVGTTPVSFQYDGLGRVIQQINKDGEMSQITYSSDESIVSNLFSRGSLTIAHFSPSRKMIAMQRGGYSPEFYTYGVDGNGIQWVQCSNVRNGNAAKGWKAYYDMYGRSFSRVELRSGGRDSTETTSFDAFGRVERVDRDSMPSEWFSYSVNGEIKKKVEVANSDWRETDYLRSYFVRDGAIWTIGDMARSCSDEESRTTAIYSSKRLTGFPVGMIEEVESSDERGNIAKSKTLFDANTREVSLFAFVEGTTNPQIEQRLFGNKVYEVSRAMETNWFGYDGMGRLSVVSNGVGRVTRYAYYSSDRLQSIEDAAGNTKQFYYDEAGNLVTEVDKDGISRNNVYNENNQLIEGYRNNYYFHQTFDEFGHVVERSTRYGQDDGNTTTTAWTYDPASGLLVRQSDDYGVKVFEYDLRGRQTKKINARGVETSYLYDDWGNLRQIDHSDNSPSSSFEYDVDGKMIRAVSSDIQIEYYYDSIGSLTNEVFKTLDNVTSVSRHYDNNGRDVGYSVDGNRVQTIEYDPATGLQTSIDGVELTYLPNSSMLAKQSLFPGFDVQYRYDRLSEALSGIVNNGEIDFQLSRDAKGRIVRANETTYSYTECGDLLCVSNSAGCSVFQYDGSGLRLGSVSPDGILEYAPTNGYRISSIVSGDETFEPRFDQDGNQTRIQTGTGHWDVAFDANNNPICFSNEQEVVSFRYDPFGRCISRTHLWHGVTNSVQLFYFRDDACIGREEFVGVPSRVVTAYDSIPESYPKPMIDFVLRQDGVETNYFLYDFNRNIIGRIGIDANFQTNAHRFGWSVWGEHQGAFEDFDDHLFGFSAQPYDSVLGLSRYRYRWYNPRDGRWLSHDRIDSEINPYLFVRNDPVNNSDQLGLDITPYNYTMNCTPVGQPSVTSYFDVLERWQERRYTVLKVSFVAGPTFPIIPAFHVGVLIGVRAEHCNCLCTGETNTIEKRRTCSQTCRNQRCVLTDSCSRQNGIVGIIPVCEPWVESIGNTTVSSIPLASEYLSEPTFPHAAPDSDCCLECLLACSRLNRTSTRAILQTARNLPPCSRENIH